MITYRIRRLNETGSTNDDAKQSAEAGEGEGLVIHALQQTAGRGRQGRTWESPEGNLYCSLLLRPAGGLPAFGQFSFIASLALSDTVRELLPRAAVTLKWPNDVLVDGKKISGILLESGSSESGAWLVVGIGLNILHHPENALYPTTSLHASGALALDGERIFDSLLDHFASRYEMFRQEGFAPIRAAWLEKAQKGHITARLPDGTVEGDFADIGETGCLRLRLADGTEKAIAAGDVFFASGE